MRCLFSNISAAVPGAKYRTTLSTLARWVHKSGLLNSYLPHSESSSSIMSGAVKNWCFTLNNYTDAHVAQLESLGPRVNYLIYGKEVSATGTPHLQGFVQLQDRKRLNFVKQLIGGNPHCEKARNVPASVIYCKKEGDYTEIGSLGAGAGSRGDLDSFKDAVKGGLLSLKEIRETHSEVYAKYVRYCLEYVQDHSPQRELSMHPLRPWQEELNTQLNNEPDDRTITFVVDSTGNAGKTWFAHYYKESHDEGKVQVIQPGRKADMAYCLQNTIRVLFIDAPRSKQGEYLQYDFIEDVKNGYVFSTKYESREKQLAKCHVVVLMNEQPDMDKLSIDRYQIINL